MKARNKERGARAQILSCFIIFIAIAIALLTLLQVFFLKYIYRAVKLSEMNDAAEHLADAMRTDRLYPLAEDLADSRGVCSMIFDPTYSARIKLLSSPPAGCLLYDLSSADCADIYRSLKSSDDSRLVRSASLTRNSFLSGQHFDSRVDLSDYSFFSDDDQQNVILAILVTNADGDEIMLIVNTFLTPISAITRTIGIILVVVGIILVLLAFVIARYLSGRIAKPLARMNNRAKLLGEGNYDVRFDESAGYREASELASTLNHAASELSKVDALKNELIANISHDLRTPLTLISGYSEIMRDIPGEITTENLQTIIDETSRLSSLVSDMLEISKIQSGNVTLSVESFNVADELEKIKTTYNTLAGRMGYNISVECIGDGRISADRELTVRAIMNLVNNAMTYTGDDRAIGIRMIGKESAVRVEISDSGDGIPPDKLDQIWERYYKVDADHKRASKGSGLGLSIVRSIVTMHGGGYGVRSREGHGSVFWIELPRTPGTEIGN